MNSTFIFYLFVEFTAIFLLYVGLKQENKKKSEKIKVLKNPFILLSMLSLLLVVVLRDISVGVDYINYKNYYLKICDGSIANYEIKNFGYLFYLAAKTFSIIFGNRYIIFYGFVAGLTIYLLYNSIIRYSKKPCFSIYVLFSFCIYYQIFNQIRQLLAIAIVLYALRYIFDKKFWKYFLVIGMTFFIHKSVIVMLPCYFIFNSKFNGKKLILYILAALILFFSSDIIRIILQQTSYSHYINSGFDKSFGINTIMNFGVRLVMLISVLYFSKKAIDNNPKNIVYYHAVTICTILQFLTMQISLFGRITTYFYIFYIFLIPEVFDICFTEKKDKKIALFILIVLFLLYHYVYLTSSFGGVGSGYSIYRLR